MEQQRMQETRRYERFPCAQLVTIRCQEGNTEEIARALVIDVSLGGLKMRTKATLDPSKTYVLTMGNGNAPVNFHGTIVHLSTATDANGETGVGFVFRPESHEERVAIANFVHQVFSQAWHAEAA